MFIPIESVNLYVYLAYHQLIMPFKYRRKSTPSIQDNFPNQILLSKYKWINNCHLVVDREKEKMGYFAKNCNVSVEIDIDEKELISIGDGFYLLNNILPINRIKKVYFKVKDQMIVTIGNIKISSAFVPKEWLEVDTNPINHDFRLDNLTFPNITPIDFTDEIYHFDKYMGGLIVLQDFQEDFNSVLSFFDKSIEHDPDNNLLKFLENDSSLKDIIMYRQVTMEDVKKIADRENISIETIARHIKIKLIDKESDTYIYALLHEYRRVLDDKFDGLLTQINSLKDTNIDRYKGLIFLYGLMLGYKHLSFELYVHGELVCNRFKYEDEKDFETLEILYNSIFSKSIPQKIIKITKKERIKKLKTLNLEESSLADLAIEFRVSEVIIKKDLKEIILKSSRGYSEKVELLKKFKMRTPKDFQLVELRKILKDEIVSTKEIAEKLQVSIGTARKYLKEIKNKHI